MLNKTTIFGVLLVLLMIVTGGVIVREQISGKQQQLSAAAAANQPAGMSFQQFAIPNHNQQSTGTLLQGTQNKQCALLPDSGPCKAVFNKYYFDQSTKTCKQFLWGGCNGTVPFDSLEQCQTSCAL